MVVNACPRHHDQMPILIYQLGSGFPVINPVQYPFRFRDTRFQTSTGFRSLGTLELTRLDLRVTFKI